MNLEQREGRWVLPDMVGKGNRLRTVTIPAGVIVRIDLWTVAAGIFLKLVTRLYKRKECF